MKNTRNQKYMNKKNQNSTITITGGVSSLRMSLVASFLTNFLKNFLLTTPDQSIKIKFYNCLLSIKVKELE